MKIECLKLVNSRETENIIFSCEKQFLPAELRSEPNATQCTVFYYPERDALVLNEGNPNYSHYKELLVEYLNFNNFEKKELHAYMDSENIPSSFFSFIDRILRIQRKRSRIRRAMAMPII